MLKRLTYLVLPFSILLGVLLISIHIFDINGMSVITKESINYYGKYTWTFYKLDLPQYVKNLETSIQIDQLTKIFPQVPTFPRTPSGIDVIEWLRWIGNLFPYMVNWIIYIENIILLAPLKLLLYPVNILMAIFGLNTASNEAIQAFNMLYNINIPFIPYI